MTRTVAEHLRPAVLALLGAEPTIPVRFWDGSSLGPIDTATAVAVNSPDAFRRMLYAPGELGIARAYVAGDLDIDGEIFEVLRMRDQLLTRDPGAKIRFGARGWSDLLRAAARLKALGLPLPAPRQEARLSGRLHSRKRDAEAILHHYDVSNDFYRLVLGETMTYSCAYFQSPEIALDDAQRAKYDLVCRKLGLRRGMRLLDVGCGWGGMLVHAAENYGVEALGITLSLNQFDYASKLVARAGLASQVEVRLHDYHDLSDEPFDAISSIGMFEHVGLAEMRQYLATLHNQLRPGGRLLNHAISRPAGRSGFDRKSFVARYVFPDGELIEVGNVVTAMQELGFEVRDVESLREHYALTLRRWVGNLEANWEDAVASAGLPRAKIWRLYMAGSGLAFESGRINVHQVLAVRPDPLGSSGMPLTRKELLGF